jgi:hypothetical protein
MLGEFGSELQERLHVSRQAEKATTALDAWAEEKLEGYKELKGTEDWNTTWDIVREQVRRGLAGEPGGLVVPEGEDDVYKFMVKRTYKTLQAMQAGEKKVAKQSESERIAAAIKGGRKVPASKSQDDSDDVPEEIKKIRQIGTGTIGKRFS